MTGADIHEQPCPVQPRPLFKRARASYVLLPEEYQVNIKRSPTQWTFLSSLYISKTTPRPESPSSTTKQYGKPLRR